MEHKSSNKSSQLTIIVGVQPLKDYIGTIKPVLVALLHLQTLSPVLHAHPVRVSSSIILSVSIALMLLIHLEMPYEMDANVFVIIILISKPTNVNAILQMALC
jgi:hypothetical protein